MKNKERNEKCREMKREREGEGEGESKVKRRNVLTFAKKKNEYTIMERTKIAK